MGYNMLKKKKDAVSNISESWDLLKANFDLFKEQYETFDVVRVGRFLEGKGYYHEVDEEYTLVGFEVEVDVRLDLGDGKLTEMSRETGFYAVWMGRAHKMAPFTFEESYRPFGESARFDNGLGDHFEVHNVLATVEEVERALNEQWLA